MSFSIEVLNTIRANADTEYQDRVPVATKENIATIGRTFQDYDVVYNTFANALIHKIGKTIIETALFENKLKKFKSGTILTMQDIEEIWVEQFRTAEGSYDLNGGMSEGATNHPLKRRGYQDVKVMYHRMNRQDYYAITLYKDDVIRAFRNDTTLSAFMTAQFNSIYTGAEYDEYNHMKQLLAEGITNGDFYDYQVAEIKDTDSDTTIQRNCKKFIRTVKKAINDIGYVSTLYNPAHVKTKTDKSNMVLFINKDIIPHLDVDLYSTIFGPNYASLGIEIVELDNFGSDTSGTYALLVDKDWFKVYDNKSEMATQENAVGLYKNYFYHVWQTLSYSKFKTAIRFGTNLITAATE